MNDILIIIFIIIIIVISKIIVVAAAAASVEMCLVCNLYDNISDNLIHFKCCV